MRRFAFVIIALAGLLFVSCNNSKDRDHKRKKALVSSTGPINSLSVIIDDSLWKGEVGESIRDNFAQPVIGLPQEEPLFSLNHIPPKAFSGFTRLSRIFIKIEPHQKENVKVARDVFAYPQTGIFISGENSDSIIKLIESNAHKIISALKRTEIKENQRRISKSLESSKVLEDKFGLQLKFPTAYRYTTKKDDFVWIRKDIPRGSMELLVYQVPLSVIDKDTNVVGNIIKMRDSIGKKYIPGPTEGTYMITEKAYAPFLFKTKIDGKFTYGTKGNWEVKGAFMAGPFVNYAIRDEKHHRYLVLEGFVFKPSANKRDNVFELKSIIHSAKIE